MLKQTNSFFKIYYTSSFENLLYFFVNICLLDLRFPNLRKEPCQVEDQIVILLFNPPKL